MDHLDRDRIYRTIYRYLDRIIDDHNANHTYIATIDGSTANRNHQILEVADCLLRSISRVTGTDTRPGDAQE